MQLLYMAHNGTPQSHPTISHTTADKSFILFTGFLLFCFFYLFGFIGFFYWDRIITVTAIQTIPVVMNEKVVVPDSIIVVTRVHMKSASSMPASDKVVEFVQSVSTFASHVLVCVGANNYSDAEAYIALLVSKFDNMGIMKETVTLLPIIPWGYFTTALNAAILFSQDKNFKYVLFQVHNL